MQSLVCQSMSCRTIVRQDISVSVVTRLRAGISEVRFLVKERDFPLHQDVQTGSGGPPSLLCSGYRDCFRHGKAAGSLTSLLHLVLRLRVSFGKSQVVSVYVLQPCGEWSVRSELGGSLPAADTW